MVPMLHGVGIEEEALLYQLGLCLGDENGSTRVVLGESRPFTLVGCRFPSTVEPATADIVCVDVMKGQPTSYQA
jgi:hypothetical protein